MSTCTLEIPRQHLQDLCDLLSHECLGYTDAASNAMSALKLLGVLLEAEPGAEAVLLIPKRDGVQVTLHVIDETPQPLFDDPLELDERKEGTSAPGREKRR